MFIIYDIIVFVMRIIMRRTKMRKLVLLQTVCLMMFLFGCANIEKTARIPMDSNEVCRSEYQNVVSTLENLGFENIEVTPLKDLSSQQDKGLNKVIDKISINGVTEFNAEEKFELSSKIEIKYHSFVEKELPITSEEAKGKTLDEVVELFKNSSFYEVKTAVIRDLDKDNVCEVETEYIEVESKKDYTLNEVYPIDSKIVIYHSYIEDKLPITSEEAKGKTYDKIEELFNGTKFQNINMKFENGGNKDSELEYRVEEILVNGEREYSIEESYPINSEIEVHFVVKKYDISFDLECNENLFLNTYDISVYVGSELLGTLGHGKSQTFTTELQKGQYELILKSKEDSSIVGKKTFNIKANRTLRYIVTCAGSEVKMKYMKQLKVPYTNKEAQGMQIADIEKAFKEAGFKKITLKAMNDLSATELQSSNTVAKIKIDKKSSFSKKGLFYTDSKVVVDYHCGQEIETPMYSSDAKGANYESIMKSFTDAGFTNVSAQVYTGTYKSKARNNQVQSVTINGDDYFSKGEKVALDANIVVSYYSIQYESATVTKLMNDLEANAYNAKAYYDERYVSLTGRVDSIDASGKKFYLRQTDNKYAIQGVLCYITSDEQKQVLSQLSSGMVITVKGHITEVGEFIGYSLDIHEIIR